MSEAKAVVDSSGWIEVFTNGPLADQFMAVLDAEAAVMQQGLAAARSHQARLYTMNSDLQGIIDVQVLCRS